IQPENQTLASITFQNYFRLYAKLAGMTGTAATEANEFLDIYKLDVIEIPTNRPVDRRDEHDEVYRTSKEKARAIVAEIADCYRRGQPILVGTVSIEKSEILSGLLKDRTYIRELGQYLKKQADSLKPGKEDELKAQLDEVGGYLVDLAKRNSGDAIPHQVLNARYHEQEAMIIAQAGVPGTVTIATNMAGRGTDIQLGGNDSYRARDWLREEIEAGRMAAVYDAGESQEGIRQWIDDVLTLGDEWVDSRLGQWIDGKLAEWTREQGAAGRTPSARETAKKRAELEGERRAVAGRRAELAREYAKLQAGAGPLNGHDGATVDGWTDQPLRREAQEWMLQAGGTWRFGSISETLFRFMSARARALAEKEAAAGREADLAGIRAAIVAKLAEVRTKCAEIQADVAEKKQKAIEAGGLYVLGTERHESRRIDNQLRGRSGRQGDPGESRFFLSAEDDLIRLFAGERIYKILDRLGPVNEAGEEEPLEAKMLTRTIENAQKKVEEQNFLIRKRVLEYDDVMNEQRRVIYKYRREILEGKDMSDAAREGVGEVVSNLVDQYTPGDVIEDWDLGELQTQVQQLWPSSTDVSTMQPEQTDREDLREALLADALAAYDQRERDFGEEIMRQLERAILLQIIDNRWREHLFEMDYLREGIHLRGFAQIDPLVAYKNEGFAMFEALMNSIWEEFARLIFHVEVEVAPQAQQEFAPTGQAGGWDYSGGGPEQPSALGQAAVATAAGPDVAAERAIEGQPQ